ncbi:hypothetical protein BDZ91DRAFT_560339 [Kalaharituber pfeilii]|nr:hypothetical protein BDZ91DRAFT_560339 [Kalaharituber pfeilii]
MGRNFTISRARGMETEVARGGWTRREVHRRRRRARGTLSRDAGVGGTLTFFPFQVLFRYRVGRAMKRRSLSLAGAKLWQIGSGQNARIQTASGFGSDGLGLTSLSRAQILSNEVPWPNRFLASAICLCFMPPGDKPSFLSLLL